MVWCEDSELLRCALSSYSLTMCSSCFSSVPVGQTKPAHVCNKTLGVLGTWQFALIKQVAVDIQQWAHHSHAQSSSQNTKMVQLCPWSEPKEKGVGGGSGMALGLGTSTLRS